MTHHQLQVVQTVLPYHCVMTPKWIHNNAVITGPHALYPQYLEILPTTGVNNQRALQIQLVAPNILTSTDSVTVTVTVAVDVSYASSYDHDPYIGISDGLSFIGIIALDRTSHPCRIREGNSNTAILTQINGINGPTVTSRRYSSEIKIQLKPAEQWGSCHTEHDGGYTNVGNYQRLLDPSRGLYLEIYHDNPTEKYHIKYIVVDVDLD